MNIKTIAKAAFVFSSVAIISCSGSKNGNGGSNSSDTAAGKNSKQVMMFDGKTLAGWHGYNKGNEKVTNWTIIDGALVCLGAAKWDTGGDLVSDKQYGNFDLSWEWKIEKGGNSGVMYHVIEDKKYKGPYETGPEYQMIDDLGWPGKLEPWQLTGADYAMNLPNEKKKLNPIGEWNTSRIVYNNGQVEHWLNGEKIVDFKVGTEAWNKEKAEGKWKDYPDYATVKKGHIALQDHGRKAYFKNIVIREL